MDRNWVLASRNRGKAKEFQDLLTPWGITIEPLFLGEGEVVPEEGSTYLENAVAKATWTAARLRRMALSDDSGIEVDALNGQPGLRSARYVSDDGWVNLRTVLLKLMTTPWEQRTARMRATVVLAWPDGHYRYGEGTIEGRVVMVPRGTHGFGYDPAFQIAEGKTLAELTSEEKDAISHRQQALHRLLEELGPLSR